MKRYLVKKILVTFILLSVAWNGLYHLNRKSDVENQSTDDNIRAIVREMLHEWKKENVFSPNEQANKQNEFGNQTKINLKEEKRQGLVSKMEIKKSPNYTCDLLPRDKQFEEIVAKYATDNIIILAVTDLGYVEMALNLYESSFKRFNIKNYIFVCSHEKAEQYLTARNLNAITLWNETFSVKESLYAKGAYRNKTNYKTDSVYMALCMDYSVFLVDVDIVFLRNPLPYMLQYAQTHDLIIQNEYNWINSGERSFEEIVNTSILILTHQMYYLHLVNLLSSARYIPTQLFTEQHALPLVIW